MPRPKSSAGSSTTPPSTPAGPAPTEGASVIPPPEMPGSKKKPSAPVLLKPRPFEPPEPDESELEEQDDAEGQEELEIAEEEARRAYEEGTGVGAGNPEELVRPGGERRVVMEPVERELNRAGRRNDGPLGTDTESMDSLAKLCSRFGSVLRIRCRRLYPDDMPPSEMALSSWFDVPGGETERQDTIREMISRRFGGGRYELEIADHDPSEYSKRIHTTLDAPGDPIPQSFEGRRWFLQRYGFAPAAPVTPDGKPIMQPVSGGDGIMGIVSLLLQQQQQAQSTVLSQAERDKDREAGLVPHLLSFAQNKSTGIQSLLPVLPIVLEFVKMMREDSRRDRESNEARFEKLLEKLSDSQKPQTPETIMAGVNSMLQITQKRAELELQSAQKRSDIILEHMVKQLRDSGRDEDAGFLQTLLGMMKESGPELLKNAMPLLAGMVQGAQRPMPAQQMAMRAAPVAAQPAGPVRTGPIRPSPAANGRAPEVFPNPPKIAEQASPSAPETPAPEAPAAAPAVPDAPAPSAQPELQRPNPAAIAEQIAMVSLTSFLGYVAAFAQSISDVDAAWAFATNGNSVETMFGLCPAVFRQRVAETDIDKPFLVEAWVEGAPESIVAQARELDQLLAASGESRKWLCDFLSVGPWVPEEDDEE